MRGETNQVFEGTISIQWGGTWVLSLLQAREQLERTSWHLKIYWMEQTFPQVYCSLTKHLGNTNVTLFMKVMNPVCAILKQHNYLSSGPFFGSCSHLKNRFLSVQGRPVLRRYSTQKMTARLESKRSIYYSFLPLTNAYEQANKHFLWVIGVFRTSEWETFRARCDASMINNAQ